MSSNAWRNVFTYNKFSQIGARALRASLKEESRVAAEKHGLTAVRYQKWENGQGGKQVFLNPPEEKEVSKSAAV